MYEIYYNLVMAMLPEIRRALRWCRYSYKFKIYAHQGQYKDGAWIAIYRRGDCASALVGCGKDGLVLDLFSKTDNIRYDRIYIRRGRYMYTRSLRQCISHTVFDLAQPDAFDILMERLRETL